MNKTSWVLLVLACVAILLYLSERAGIRTFPGLEGLGGKSGSVAAKTEPSGSGETAAGKSLDFDDIRALIHNLDENQRDNILSDRQAFQQLLHRESNNLSLLAAARANNLHKDPDIRFLMSRAGENLLREIYLKKLLDSRIPEDFPDDEQVRDYFENNREQFVLGERVHVWQIFLPLAEGVEEDKARQVTEQARQLADDLRAGKLGFASAALEYSAHPQSKSNGGYMGLLKVDELRPELADSILSLPENEISQPVRGEQGLHIFRRGAVVPVREVALEEVMEQIRTLLRNQASAHVRTTIHEQAAAEYPAGVDEDTIEDWRLRLQAAFGKN